MQHIHFKYDSNKVRDPAYEIFDTYLNIHLLPSNRTFKPTMPSKNIVIRDVNFHANDTTQENIKDRLLPGVELPFKNVSCEGKVVDAFLP